jgi:hypothetical protein
MRMLTAIQAREMMESQEGETPYPRATAFREGDP